MGIISKGILGPVSGTVGTVVGGTWKGISYLRSQTSSKKTSFTIKQLEQQAKFSLTMQFLQSMTPLLSESFREYAVKMTGFNNAMRYTLLNGIAGTYPAYTINYSTVLVSRGDLPPASNPTAASTSSGVVDFSWVNNSGQGKAQANDNSILVVYCPDLNQCVYTTAGAIRSGGSGTILVNAFKGFDVETYVGFVSADGKNVATSVYTGQVTVAA